MTDQQNTDKVNKKHSVPGKNTEYRAVAAGRCYWPHVCLVSAASESALHNQQVFSPGPGPRRSSNPSVSPKSPGANTGAHNRANQTPMASKGHGGQQLKGPLVATNHEGPRSPPPTTPQGLTGSRCQPGSRWASPGLSHTPQQWPTGANLHFLTPSNVSNIGPSPPRQGRLQESCRSGSKSLLHQTRSQISPSVRLTHLQILWNRPKRHQRY